MFLELRAMAVALQSMFVNPDGIQRRIGDESGIKLENIMVVAYLALGSWQPHLMDKPSRSSA